MGKTNSSRLFRLAPSFQFFDTFIPDNDNAGGTGICIHKDLLPDDATGTHIVTCQGRDHFGQKNSDRHRPF